MNNVNELIRRVQEGTATLQDASHLIDQIQHDEFHGLMQWLSEIAVGSDSIDDAMWSVILAAISHRKKICDEPFQLDESALIRALYGNLGQHRDQRYHLLARLTKQPNHNNLVTFTELIVNDPPRTIASVSAPFLPLFSNRSDFEIDAIFPRLLDGLSNPDLAPPILDLANFVTRSEKVATHPAADRIDHLLRLVEAVVANLSELQTTTATSTDDLRNKQQAVANSLPLAISLCDALGLIGDDRAIPYLTRLAELKHRRLRVEAAAAIIRLEQNIDPENVVQPLRPKDAEDEEQASDAVLMLADMAAEPVVRLRAVTYADELGVTEQIAFEHRSPIAMAEAELTAYLAEPMQMGMPPARCELIDSRVLYWPGYEEPRNCYLFKFNYLVANPENSEASNYESIGIAGPLVHAFHADLSSESIEQIYSAFAGFHAEHEDIEEVDLTNSFLRSQEQSIVESLTDRLRQNGLREIEPQIFASFFGESTLVVKAINENSVHGVAVIDEAGRESWYSFISATRPIGPVEAWYIYKGNRLLRSFNSDDFDV